MQRSYTIQSNGDYLRVDETPERDAVIVSIANNDHLRVATATIRLNKEQWDALTGLGYSDIELNYREEANKPDPNDKIDHGFKSQALHTKWPNEHRDGLD